MASLLLSATAVQAQDTGIGQLREMSLEELSNLRITSVSKHAERLSDAPAAVFVITAEDIRRSGATTLPEALRLAPNLHVSRESASDYLVTARGFNASNANKMLVLVDGRSVYTPLFSGVFWDVQDVLLENVDRIEVISGPGGTLWGVNAVNGVINVITAPAAQNVGRLVMLGGGNRESQAGARYGTSFGDDGHVRLHAKHTDQQRTHAPDGSPRDDAWRSTQAGFRADWQHRGDGFTVLGNVYDAAIGQPQPGTFFTGTPLALGTISASGLNLLGRWERAMDDGATLSVQAYLDHTRRIIPPTLSESLDIVDLQVQHGLRPTGIHSLVWGIEIRHGWDRVGNSLIVAFLPAHVQQHWTSLFAQDEMSLGRDWRLTVGARVDRNDYTGSEFLPNARLAWKPAPDHLLWAALSRTVRAPSRLDRDVHVPGEGPPFTLAGGPAFESELAKVAELGWRGQPTERSTFSATLFRADYDDLRTLELAPAGSGTAVTYMNRMKGRTEGIEAWGSLQATQRLRLAGGYSRLAKRLRLDPGSLDLDGASHLEDPKERWMLRASLDLPAQQELDATLRHVSATTNPQIAAYTTLDLRWGWRPRAGLELSVTAQNLTDGGHTEIAFLPPYRSEIGRSVFFKVAWRF
ncbi:MAG TPA: TonB-dependent receptor [Albitalea sp.]|uniref:TonB-dependent receptor plug domain-containing protein n=1 Tax=Piscinibacter sp. TaxID=1903157 RepID=UPI002ED56907